MLNEASDIFFDTLAFLKRAFFRHVRFDTRMSTFKTRVFGHLKQHLFILGMAKSATAILQTLCQNHFWTVTISLPVVKRFFRLLCVLDVSSSPPDLPANCGMNFQFDSYGYTNCRNSDTRSDNLRDQFFPDIKQSLFCPPKNGLYPQHGCDFPEEIPENFGKTPETLSERFLQFPSRVRLGSPKPHNSRHVKLPENFQNSLPLSTAGDASLFRTGSGKGLSELVMEFPAVLSAFLKTLLAKKENCKSWCLHIIHTFPDYDTKSELFQRIRCGMHDSCKSMYSRMLFWE